MGTDALVVSALGQDPHFVQGVQVVGVIDTLSMSRYFHRTSVDQELTLGRRMLCYKIVRCNVCASLVHLPSCACTDGPHQLVTLYRWLELTEDRPELTKSEPASHVGYMLSNGLVEVVFYYVSKL